MSQELGGRYELVRPLGEGGMGQVFLAVDRQNGQEVALKVLSQELAHSPEARVRFREEFLTMRRVAHPRVVAAYDFGALADDRLFMAMEVVPGPGLEEQFPLPAEVARTCLVQALDGLAYLHASGLIHGDLKPDNLRLGADGALKLMDLGLAVPVGAQPRSVQGTPLYLAPEAVRCDRLDGRSDLYALGAVFYHLLAGQPPFEAESAVQLLQAHLHEAPVPLAERVTGVPSDLATLVDAMLAKAPQDRPASPAAALRMLGVEPGASAGLVPAPFVGRVSELETLVGRLGGEQLTSTVVAGPLGIGKSRLLQEVASRLQVAGRTVVSSVAEPTAQPLGSLSPLRRKLESMVADVATLEGIRRILDQAGDVLDPRSAMLARQGAWQELVQAAAGRQPLVIAIDDWEAADEASRNVVLGLINGHDLRVGFLLASTEEGSADALCLGPLSEVEVGEFAARSLGLTEVSPLLAAGLVERSGGSPLLVEALLAELVKQDAIPREGDLWRTDKVDWSRAKLPEGAQGLIRHRAEELSGAEKSLAQAFALLRQPRPLTDVGAWLGWEEGPLVEAAAGIRQKGFLSEGEWGMRLAQPALAPVLLEGCAVEALHRAIAAGLEARTVEDDAPDLAFHLLAAGEPQRALPFAIMGARLLLGRYGLQEAERLLATTLDLATGDDRSQVQELRGDLLRMRGDLAEAEACYREALEHRNGRTAHLKTSLSLVCQMLSRFDEALSFARSGADAAAQEGLPGEGARAWTTVSRIHSLTGDMAQAEVAAQRALELARAGHARGFEAEALGLLGYYKVAEPGQAEQAIAYLQEALAIRTELGDRVGLNDAYMFLGNAQMALGRYPEAHETFERNLALCRELGAARNDEITALLNLAQVDAEAGALDSALSRLSEALDMAVAAGDQFLKGYALALRARVRAELGHLAPALEDAREARTLADELESKYLALVAEAFNAQVLLATGDRLGALESLRTGLALSAETGISEFDLLMLGTQGEAYGQLGDRRRALQSLDKALSGAEETRAMGAIARARLARTALEVPVATETARVQLAETKAAIAETGMQALGARAMLLEAALLVNEGRVHEAAHLYREAQIEAVRLGLTLVAADAAHGLAEWDPAEDAQLVWRASEASLARLLGTLPDDLQESFRARYLRPLAVAEAPQAGHDRSMASVVADFGRMVTGTLSYREVLDRVIDQVMSITRAERGMIMLVDSDGALGGLVVRPRLEGDASLMAFSRSFADAALRERRSIWVADAQSDARFAAAKSVMALDLRTVICVPLLVDDAVIGLLYLDQQSVNRKFSEADLHLVEGLAGFAALAIANARRFEEAQERTKLLAAIQELSRLVSAQLERAEIERVILQEVLSVGRSEQGSLLLGEPLQVVLTQGEPQEGAALVERARQTGRSATEVDAERVSRLALPLMANHRLCGVLYLERAGQQPVFTPSEVSVLEAIGAQAAIALDTLDWREQQLVRSSRLEKALQLIDDQRDASKVDELTGLFTPDYLSDRLAQEIREASRYQQPLSLMVLDPERMGELNERFGTETGDAMLRQIAEELAGKCRKTDVLCRLGGDEFAIVMPQTPAVGAEIFSERLRKHLSELAICDDAGTELWSFEAAIAVVEWRAAEAPEAFLDRAISALG